MASDATIVPPPSLPNEASLELVRVMDEIRRVHDSEEEFEFSWFAREYPQIFRHHANHDWRLQLDHARYVEAQRWLAARLNEDEEGKSMFSVASSSTATLEVYWAFESRLQAIGSALDILAWIAALECRHDAPSTFSRLAKHNGLPSRPCSSPSASSG